MIDDPVAALGELLRAAGARVTFDPERSIAKPCIICGRTDVPRGLVEIGKFTRPIGGHAVGQAISRPMCKDCERMTTP